MILLRDVSDDVSVSLNGSVTSVMQLVPANFGAYIISQESYVVVVRKKAYNSCDEESPKSPLDLT